jgi:hypothetical protein
MCLPRGFEGGRGSCSIGGPLERINRHDKTSRLPCFILLARRDMAVRTERHALCGWPAAAFPRGVLAAARKRDTRRQHTSLLSPIANLSDDQMNLWGRRNGPSLASRFAIERTGPSRFALSFLLVQLKLSKCILSGNNEVVCI